MFSEHMKSDTVFVWIKGQALLRHRAGGGESLYINERKFEKALQIQDSFPLYIEEILRFAQNDRVG